MKLQMFRYKLYVILGSFILSGCSSYVSTWQSNQFKVDGKASDWDLNMVSHKSGKYSYKVSNDSQSLYLQLKVNDQQIQKKLLMKGFTLWIDTLGKTNTGYGIKFPLEANEMGRNLRAGNKGRDRDRSQSRNEGRQGNLALETLVQNRIKEAELLGFDGVDSRFMLLEKNKYQIEIAVKLDEYFALIYEARIPLKEILTNPDVFISNEKNKLSIGLETGFFTIQNRPMEAAGPAGKGMSSGGGRGSGGRGGGSRGGGGRGGSKGGMPQTSSPSFETINLAEPTKIWIKKISLSDID